MTINNIEGMLCGIIIAKNESSCISYAVGSLMPLCSQIVVIDTGSSDETPRIAATLGCEVYFRLWDNDFSAARNYAFEFVRRDWIISLDSDEILLPFPINEVVSILQNNSIGGISCNIRNYLDNELLSFTDHIYTRIFRNTNEIRYKGKIHEQISESIINAGYQIANSKILIEHFGYIGNNPVKQNRNKQLLLEEIENYPNDDWLSYHLANTEFSSGNLSKAKELFLQIQFSKQLSKEQIEVIKLRLLQISIKFDDFNTIQAYINFTFQNKAYEGLKYFALSSFYMKQNKFDLAYSSLISSLNCNSPLVNSAILNFAIAELKRFLGR